MGRLRLVHRNYDLAKVVTKAVDRVAGRMLHAGLTLFTEIPSEELAGFGDAERLGRALDHLLDNAAKFTPAGGRVGVRVRALRSSLFEICVADSGPGVDGAVVGRIFDPFF